MKVTGKTCVTLFWPASMITRPMDRTSTEVGGRANSRIAWQVCFAFTE